jgi:hypothetical protein
MADEVPKLDVDAVAKLTGVPKLGRISTPLTRALDDAYSSFVDNHPGPATFDELAAAAKTHWAGMTFYDEAGQVELTSERLEAFRAIASE